MDRLKYLYSNISEFDEHIEYLEEHEMKLLKAHKLDQESKLQALKDQNQREEAKSVLSSPEKVFESSETDNTQN